MAYYGSFMKGKTMWICMEFCGGGSVSDMYNGLQHGLSEPEIAGIMFYSLKGLDYLHHQHKVHRDIKVSLRNVRKRQTGGCPAPASCPLSGRAGAPSSHRCFPASARTPLGIGREATSC